MSLILTSPCCMPCEKYKFGVGVLILDENGNPVVGIKGTLTDAAGNSRSITLTGAPLVFDKLPGGEVTLRFDAASWLKEMQTRKPFEQAATHYYPAQTWRDENSHDAEVDCEREFIEATMGDFIEPEEGEHLPPRHQAGAAGEVSLFAAMSAVVMIRGFTSINLRLGFFFDGTANNTYSARWGKEQFDSIRATWYNRVARSGGTGKDKFGTTAQYQAALEYMPDDCCIPKKFVDDLEGSATNELTNVQKMFDLYKNDQFSEDGETYYHAEYVTGIGTENNKSGKANESTLVGQGLGVGDWGVASKTQTAIEQICDVLGDILNNMATHGKTPKTIDAINKIEFDAYGFSRGAAAARDFINHVLDGEQGSFVQAFQVACQEQGLSLCDGFDWSQNEYCEVMFAGLFDTVPSIIQPLSLDLTTHNDVNPDTRQWLDPERVKRAVHIVANSRTEYRFNFSLLKLNDTDKPHFDEITVAGSHSDIGGGYYSSVTFGDHENINYWLPMYEKKYIDSVSYPTGFFTNYDAVEKKVSEALSEERKRQLHQGWLKGNVLTKTNLNSVQNRYVGQLEYINTPEGDLSRLYLRVMYGLSEHAGVPVSDVKGEEIVWTTTAKSNDGWELYYPVKKQISYKGSYKSNPPYEFGALCDQVLEEAKQGKTDILQSRTGDNAIPTFFRLGLIHHSADESLAVAVRPFGANDESLNLNASDKQRLDEEKALSQCELNCDFGDGYYRRAEFECVQGK